MVGLCPQTNITYTPIVQWIELGPSKAAIPVQFGVGVPVHIIMEMNIMKFWSELTEQLYNTPEELQEAEEKVRIEAMAAEQYQIDKAMAEKEINESIEKTRELIDNYVEKYGTFSYNVELPHNNFNDFFSLLFGKPSLF